MPRPAILLLPAVLFAAGCIDAKPSTPPAADTQTAAETAGDQAKVKAALARLSPEDRALAEQQKYCAVQTEELLGAMGTPVKVMVNDRPVFLCCKGCEKTAKKDPEKTLKTVDELKAKAAREK